jgi:serine/threonine-protein kinase
VHRDIKPSNLLVRRDRVVLTDFGLAAPAGTVGTPGASSGGEGTSGYMPPEQRRGEPASPAMDVHALGVSLDEMLAWSTPSPSDRPASLAPLLARMRAVDAAARPTLDEVRRVLEPLA